MIPVLRTERFIPYVLDACDGPALRVFDASGRSASALAYRHSSPSEIAA